MTASALSPAPISWPPSQNWDGDDGNWSSFALRVGSPEQDVRVLISTAGENTWVVGPGGCPPGTPGTTPSSTCSQSRGMTFNSSLSNTWSSFGNYSLGVETNLGADTSASYAFDTVALGLSNATGGPTLQRQVVAKMESNLYYTGLFGLGNQPTNLTASAEAYNLTNTTAYTSFLTTMKEQKLIPSLSWAYTAGAFYRLKGVFGSLTFGGYDLSRLVPNNVTFYFAPDISRDLVVSLQTITSIEADGAVISLLPNPILTFIDSTLPFIYLPLEACRVFEQAFSLTYNDTARLYTVNDTLYQSLTRRNPNITFQIGNSLTGGPTVNIVLPYTSFDLFASYPRIPDGTRYFPLKKAANETQYTLGRTFLQEAYLIANYEFNNFSVSQARFEDGLPQNIIALPSAHPPPTTQSHSRISNKSIIGLSIGLTAAVIITIILVYVLRKKRRKHSAKNDKSKSSESPRNSQKINPIHISGVHEADNNSLGNELPDNGKVELLDANSPSGSGNKISEMPQSPSPAPLCELGTRHTSLANSSLRRQSDRNRGAIYVSTGIWRRESGDSSGALKEFPRVETKISSSPPRHESPEQTRPLPTRRPLTLKYLNRALPSPPGTNSTQTSLAKTSSSSPLSATHRYQSQSSQTSFSSSDPGAFHADTALDMIYNDYDMGWDSHHQRPEPSLFSSCSTDIKIMMPPEVADSQMMREYPSLSSLSLCTDVEIVVPPGTPNMQIPSSASSREGERRKSGHFF